jgi:hypothetical protein
VRRRPLVHIVVATGRTACGRTYDVGRKNLKRTTDRAQANCDDCLRRTDPRYAPAPDPRVWLGRGFEDAPGRPFGWAFNQETRAIEAHLRERGIEPRSFEGLRRVTRLRERLWRNRPTYRERQAAWKARQPAPGPTPAELLADALRRIAAGHNDARALAAETLARVGL